MCKPLIPYAFVLMPFRSSMDSIYFGGIMPACKSAGIFCERADHQQHQDNILQHIYQQIRKADIIIAEVTNKSLNVYYEVGYAHALSKQVVLITQKANAIPFDLKQYRHIIYKSTGNDLEEKLSKELVWLIKQPPLRDYQVVHPTHRDLQPRENSLARAECDIRIFTTTADSYLLKQSTRDVLINKLNNGCRVRVLLLDRSSSYMNDRQYQERAALVDKQRNSEYILARLKRQFAPLLDYRFFNCAPTYQALIIDDKQAFISIPQYGINGTEEFPCLELHSGGTRESMLGSFVRSFDTLWNESGAYSYNLISYHDSWLSVDPIIHCSYECKYCLLRIPRWTRKRPQLIYGINETVASLISHRYYVPGRTVLSFGNRTDPFLVGNEHFTCEFVEKLEANNMNNTLCIATKSSIPDAFLNFVKTLAHLKVIIFLSYSGLDSTIETGVDHNLLRDNFIRLKERGIEFVHYWRPLVSSNGSAEGIERMLEFVSRYASASVVVGLKYNPDIRTILINEPSLTLPAAAQGEYGTHLPKHVDEALVSVLREKYPHYPVFRHTSCAVSYLRKWADYNISYAYSGFCDSCNCPREQRIRCNSQGKCAPNRGEVTEALARIGVQCDFDIATDHIKLQGSVSQEDYLFLLQNLHFPIESEVGFTNIWRGNVFERTKYANSEVKYDRNWLNYERKDRRSQAESELSNTRVRRKL